MLTKRDFVRRYAQGEFGNASPTWNTFAEWYRTEDASLDWLYHIRNRITGGQTWYNIKGWDLRGAWEKATKVVGDPRLLYISAMAPSEKTILQGEVLRTKDYLNLLYSPIAKPMREAMQELQIGVVGLQALVLLKSCMNANSWDWLQYLFDAYPDHVIEFSTYSVEWGTVPGFNTVYWEVRNY